MCTYVHALAYIRRHIYTHLYVCNAYIYIKTCTDVILVFPCVYLYMHTYPYELTQAYVSQEEIYET